jgi:PAS domain S-box-containing protein
VVEEDKKEVLRLEEDLLNLDHNIIYIASSGNSAIKKTKELHPDLVLVSLVFKGDIDGTKVAEKILALNIPVIYMIRHSEEFLIQEALKTNPYGMISKPYENNHLKFSIEIALKNQEREQQLQKRTNELQLTLEATTRGIWKYDSKNDSFILSPSFFKILGYESNEFIPSYDNLISLIHPDDLEKTLQKFQENNDKKKKYFNNELRLLKKTGEYLWVFSECSIVEVDETGGPIKWIGNVSPIQERKLAEELLKISKNTLDAIISNVPITISTLNQDGIIQFINKLPDQNIHVDDYVGTSAFQNLPTDQHPLLKNALKSVFYEQKVVNYESKFCQEGEEVWFENRVTPIKDKDQVVSALFLSWNITERKKSEESLIDHFYLLENLLETIPYPTFYKNVNFAHQGCNKAFEKFSGYKESEIVGKLVFDLYPPELAEEYHKKDIEILKNPGLQTFEAPIIDFEGNQHQMLFKKDVYYDHKGKVAGIIGIMVDITELRKSEKVQEESEIMLRGLFDYMPDGISVFEVKNNGLYGKDYIIKEINQTGLEIEGKSRDEVIGKSLYDLRPTIDEFGLIKVFKEVWETGNPIHQPATLYKDENYANWYENYVFKTKSKELVSIYSDVTEKKNVEDALRVSENKFKELIENSPLAIAIYNNDGQIEFINRKITELTGYTLDDIPNLDIWLEKAYPDSKYRDLIMEKWEETINISDNENLPPITGDIVCKDGTVRIVEFYGRKIGDTTVSILNDITERKKAEDLLITSEKRLFDLIDFLPDATFAVDRNGKVISWNRAMEDLTSITTEDIVGKGNFEYSIPFYHQRRPILIDLVMDNHKNHEKFYHNILREGNTITGETEAVFDDKIHILWGKAVPIYDEEKNINGAIETIRDITDRKKAEIALRDSLKEKEVLLREIHHRVKNNLQIIASLLNLQHSYVFEEESKDVLKESQGRVKAMANIHEKLYQSPQLTNLNFKSYLHKLISELFLTYGIESDKIKYRITVKNVEIGLDTAIPCGLIINELVTNSLKYAFPHGKKGTVEVKFKENGNYYTLIVSDDGIGLSEDFNLEKIDSLGLQLVKTLVGQLDGNLEIDERNGTTFTIKFEELLYKKRL